VKPTPAELVERVASAYDAPSPPTDSSVIAALIAAGANARQADLALKLVQIACGRLLLDGLGITFSDDYLCFDAQGAIVERGALPEQPVFVEALRRMPATPKALQQLALTSADVQSVNAALHAGSDPKDLVTGPSALFVESPTDEGLAAARAELERVLRSR